MSFLDPFGLFDGGGSSSSASVSSTVNLNVQGLNDIGLKETIELKPVEIKPLTLNSNLAVKPLEIKPLTVNENIDLKPVTLTNTVDVKPLRLTETIDLKPVTLNENIDLKPVALDSCQTLRLAPLPETRICNPYHHRMSISLLGLDVLAMTWDGESEQDVHSPRHADATRRTQFRDRDWAPAEHRTASSGGIRVRVLDDDQ